MVLLLIYFCWCWIACSRIELLLKTPSDVEFRAWVRFWVERWVSLGFPYSGCNATEACAFFWSFVAHPKFFFYWDPVKTFLNILCFLSLFAASPWNLYSESVTFENEWFDVQSSATSYSFPRLPWPTWVSGPGEMTETEARPCIEVAEPGAFVICMPVVVVWTVDLGHIQKLW